MSKRKYTQVQHLLPEIKRLREEGKTHREIAEQVKSRYRTDTEETM